MEGKRKVYDILNETFKMHANRPIESDFVAGPICLLNHFLTKPATSACF